MAVRLKALLKGVNKSYLKARLHSSVVDNMGRPSSNSRETITMASDNLTLSGSYKLVTYFLCKTPFLYLRIK